MTQMAASTRRKLVRMLERAYQLGLRRKSLLTPVAGEPDPLDIVQKNLGSDARVAAGRLLSVIDDVFDGLAVSVTGAGSVFVLHREYVAQWLIELMERGDSAQQACEKFYRFSRATKAKCTVLFYVDGIRLDDTVSISDSIELGPADFTRQLRMAEDGFILQDSGFSVGIACLSKVMDLEIDICRYELRNVESIRKCSEKLFDIQERYTESTRILHELTNLLCVAAAGPVSVQDVILDWDLYSSPLALIQSPRRRNNYRRTRASVSNPRRINAQASKRLLESYIHAPEELLRNVQIPIFRLNQCFSRFEQVEAAIDLGVALEVLFTSDREPDAPIGYLLRMRGALWIGGSVTRRRHHRQILKDTYKLRSEAAHTGAIKKCELATSTIECGAKLAVVAIRKMLRRGGRPESWDDWLLNHTSDQPI